MDIKKEIVNLFNYINENNRANIKDFSIKYQELLKYVFCVNDTQEARKYISILYRIIFQTRDIINGKGEYKFAHIMIGELVKFGYTEYGQNYKSITDNLANMALFNLVYFTEEKHVEENSLPYGSLPYGSWKDIKYFCNYLRDYVLIATEAEDISELPIFKYILKLVVKQLQSDIDIINESKKEKNPSLLCKWLPREKSIKFGWLAKYIAMEYYPEWINLTTNNLKTYKKSIRKCLTHYRQIVSYVNKVLQTTQIYQCGQQWENIIFENVTKQTLKKQKAAFKNENKNNNNNNEDDRNKCRDNYNYYIQDQEEQELEPKEKEKETKMMTWNEINNELSHDRYKWVDETITKLWIVKEGYTYTYAVDTYAVDTYADEVAKENESYEAAYALANAVEANALEANAVEADEVLNEANAVEADEVLNEVVEDEDANEEDANEVLNEVVEDEEDANEEDANEEDANEEDEDEDTLIFGDEEYEVLTPSEQAQKALKTIDNKQKQGWLGWLGWN